MTAPLLIATEKKHSSLPLLIIDKPGVFSKGFVSLLSEHFTTVLVSEKNPLPHLPHVTHVAYKRKIPSIPDDYFSAILLFYHGEQALSDGLHAFVKKAKQNNAKLLLITSREHASQQALTRALAAYEEAYLVVYGDVFGVSSHEDSLPRRMITEALHEGRVRVHGSGLSESYPVYYADCLQGVLHVLLSHRSAKVNLLFPHQATPEIHLARLVTHLYPQADLQFIDRNLPKEKTVSVPEGETLIEDPYPLSQKLKLLKPTASRGKFTPERKTRTFHFFKHRSILSYGTLMAFLILVLPLLTVIFFVFGLLSLHVTILAGEKGNLPLVAKRAETSRVLFRLSENTAGPLTLFAQPVGLSRSADMYLSYVAAGKTASEVAAAIADAGIIYGKIASGEGVNPTDGMVRVTADIKQAMLGLGELRSEKHLPETYRQKLIQYQAPLTRLSSLIENLPYLTGVSRQRKYLILFQNNMELRPGGGFIGSYGLLTLKDGKIASFTIHDVYDADGQLKGHIEPPFALRRYLGVSHLFLRDSNFSIEFEQNAGLAASLLNLSTGEQVDGVITMDVSFLRMLLQKLGPVYVPAIDITVTADNFYLLTQAAAEKDFFPGSTQKKDFLQHVARALVLSLEEREQKPYVILFQALYEGMLQKHVMFASGDSGLMTLLIKNGFAPTVTKLPVEYDAAAADFLGVFDANLGVNKSNYYLKRSIAQEVMLHETGERTGAVLLTYKNTSTAKSAYGGEYKNYVQVVLPEGTKVTGVSIDGEEQGIIAPVTSSRVYASDRFVPPVGLELDEQTLYGRSVFGFLTTIPPEATKQITLRYVTPSSGVISNDFSYVLRVFKQPGTDYDPYSLVLQYDPALRLLKAPDFASRGKNAIQVTRVLSEDILLPVTFMKQ